MRYGIWLLLVSSLGRAQNPTPQDPVQGIVRLFDTYRIVMLGEIHECSQEYDLCANSSSRAHLLIGQSTNVFSPARLLPQHYVLIPIPALV
jgi:hypothetical protein